MSEISRDLAVVIPTLNAEAGLAATLAALPPVAQRIVVDGGSSDATVEVARTAGAEVLQSPPGRGVQLSAGAAAAQAPWLLFLHADTRLDARSWGSIETHLSVPERAQSAAVFGFQLDDPAWQARLVEWGVRLRVAAFALPYGDQGLLIHRDLYETVGGYNALPLMEDVDLVRRLGRRRLRLLPGYAITSATRWRRRGWARQTLMNLRCLTLYLTGTPPAEIARLYGR